MVPSMGQSLTHFCMCVTEFSLDHHTILTALTIQIPLLENLVRHFRRIQQGTPEWIAGPNLSVYISMLHGNNFGWFEGVKKPNKTFKTKLVRPKLSPPPATFIYSFLFTSDEVGDYVSMMPIIFIRGFWSFRISSQFQHQREELKE